MGYYGKNPKILRMEYFINNSYLLMVIMVNQTLLIRTF